MPSKQVPLALLRLGGGVWLNPNERAVGGAMGLPVVCTRHCGILDGKSGFLVPGRDVDALADRLADVISRPEAWPQMGRQGRAFVETEYDLEKRNDALVELYRQLQVRHSVSHCSDRS